MALSTTTYGGVGTPRFFVDNLLYARALGMRYSPGNITTEIDGSAPIIDEDFKNRRMLWDMDPVNYLNFSGDGSNVTSIKAEIVTSPADRPNMGAFMDLMHTSNYAGVLNHNLYSGGDVKPMLNLYANEEIVSDSRTLDGGNFFEDVWQDGYFLSKLNLDNENDELYQLAIEIAPGSGDDFLSYDYNYNIGTFTVGTYLDLPFAPDLEITMGYEHDGVDTRRTIGGKDLTHISYSGPPDWGKLPPFTNSHGHDHSFRGAGLTGRKSWNLKFSYIDKKDMFTPAQSGSSAGTYWKYTWVDPGGQPGFSSKTTILGTYLSRTLGGKLKHIFMPDKEKAEFHIVKLDQGSTKIKQLSTGVYEINLKIVQVW